jgi:hypothetical protein
MKDSASLEYLQQLSHYDRVCELLKILDADDYRFNSPYQFDVLKYFDTELRAIKDANRSVPNDEYSDEKVVSIACDIISTKWKQEPDINII